MENFTFDTNFLNENSDDFLEANTNLNINNMNLSNSSINSTTNNTMNTNMNRRLSLGNMNLAKMSPSSENRSWSPIVMPPLTPSPSPKQRDNFGEQFTFESPNLCQDRSSILINQQLIQQQQLQLKQRQQLLIRQQQQHNIKQQSEENLSNFIKFCSSSGVDLQTNNTQQLQHPQKFSTPITGSLPHSSSFFLPSQQSTAFNNVPITNNSRQSNSNTFSNLNSMRRKSYGPQAMSSSLKPVMESRSSSPVFSSQSGLGNDK